MDIAVNGKSLGIPEKGGVQRVALNLIHHIAQARPDIRLNVYIPSGTGLAIPHFKQMTNLNLHLTKSPLFINRWIRTMWEQMMLPFLIRGHGQYDLLLNLTNSAPVLMSPGVPQVLLVHDVGFRNTDWFSLPFTVYLTWVLRRASTYGIRCVTVSETSAEQIKRSFGRLGKVTVIANGVERLPQSLKPVAFGPKYVLFLGSLNPRKNLQGAISGFRAFRKGIEEDVRLVVIGGKNPIFGRTRVKLNCLSGDVVFLGYTDDAKKWAFIKGAELLIMPSFLEGFGLPILEALKVGTPVVASDIPVFRELYSDAVEYVNPFSPEDIARGISRVIGDVRKRQVMISRGKEMASQFSWKTAAQEYIRLFEIILGKDRRDSSVQRQSNS